MPQKNLIHRFTKFLVDFMFYMGILVCISLPFTLGRVMTALHYSLDLRLPFTIILSLAGGCALFLLWQIRRMLKTLVVGSPFIMENVSCLRRASVASFLIALIFALKLIFSFTISSTIIVIIFSLLGLFALTLKDVFKQAVAYKEDSEGTV